MLQGSGSPQISIDTLRSQIVISYPFFKYKASKLPVVK
jgi:hypothetical protein